MVGDFFKGYSQIDCSFNFNINPIQMGLIGAAHGCGEGGGQKYINHVTHPLSSADISIFHRKSAIFVISGYIGIDCILMHNF